MLVLELLPKTCPPPPVFCGVWYKPRVHPNSSVLIHTPSLGYLPQLFKSISYLNFYILTNSRYLCLAPLDVIRNICTEQKEWTRLNTRNIIFGSFTEIGMCLMHFQSNLIIGWVERHSAVRLDWYGFPKRLISICDGQKQRLTLQSIMHYRREEV